MNYQLCSKGSIFLYNLKLQKQKLRILFLLNCYYFKLAFSKYVVVLWNISSAGHCYNKKCICGPLSFENVGKTKAKWSIVNMRFPSAISASVLENNTLLSATEKLNCFYKMILPMQVSTESVSCKGWIEGLLSCILFYISCSPVFFQLVV